MPVDARSKYLLEVKALGVSSADAAKVENYFNKFAKGQMTMEEFKAKVSTVAPALVSTAVPLANVARGARDADLAMFSLNRVMQDAPFFARSANMGFMAISNNLPELFLRMQKVIKSSDGVKNALKALASQFTGSMGIIYVLQLATSALLAYSMLSDDSAESVDKFAESVENAAKSVLKFKEEAKIEIGIDTKKLVPTLQEVQGMLRQVKQEFDTLEDNLSDIGMAQSFLSSGTAFGGGRFPTESSQKIVDSLQEQYDKQKVIRDEVEKNLKVSEAVTKIMEEELNKLEAKIRLQQMYNQLASESTTTDDTAKLSDFIKTDAQIKKLINSMENLAKTTRMSKREAELFYDKLEKLRQSLIAPSDRPGAPLKLSDYIQTDADILLSMARLKELKTEFQLTGREVDAVNAKLDKLRDIFLDIPKHPLKIQVSDFIESDEQLIKRIDKLREAKLEAVSPREMRKIQELIDKAESKLHGYVKVPAKVEVGVTKQTKFMKKSMSSVASTLESGLKQAFTNAFELGNSLLGQLASSILSQLAIFSIGTFLSGGAGVIGSFGTYLLGESKSSSGGGTPDTFIGGSGTVTIQIGEDQLDGVILRANQRNSRYRRV